MKEIVAPDSFVIITNSDFVIQAQKYVYSGASLEVLCEINAQVSESVGRKQIAESWRVLGTFVKTNWVDEFDDNISFLPTTIEMSNYSSRHVQNNVMGLNQNDAEGIESERSSRSRTMTDSIGQVNGRINRRESSVTTSGGLGDRRNTRGKNASTESGRVVGADADQQQDDNQDEDDFETENEVTLTGIASGQMLFGGFVSDFFGDNEIGSGDIQLESFVTSGNGRDDEVPEIPNEAFQPRVKLNAHGAYRHQNNAEDNDFANGEGDSNGANHVNGNADADGNSSARVSSQTVVVEDQTSGLEVADWALEHQTYSTLNNARETITKCIEVGDVQSAVTMFLVVRHFPEYHNKLFDDVTLEFWFTCYIDMLHRFKLFNVANALIKKCPVESIRQLNQRSSTFLSNCTRCNKALARTGGTWWCERCKRTPNLCSICQDIVRGLYSWCQGCAHGGHLKCLKRWYSRNTLCPTGCGHHCEFQ